MFPLGTVLFPSMILPLHIFEERYRALMRHCLACTDGEWGRAFGVVLIERGSEVGGGDTRFEVGCLARIEEYEELPDGRFFTTVRGIRPLRIAEWLGDDPYPIATVEPMIPEADDVPTDVLRVCETRVRTALAHQTELGIPSPPATIELSADAVVAAWELCALVPAGPLDRQRLLSAASHRERLDLVASLAADAIDLFARRLSAG